MESEPLRTFEQIVFGAFGPVCTKFGLIHVRSEIYGPECLISFENTVAGLSVYFEMGAGAWVQVGRLHKDGSDNVVRREFYDLSFFLEERAPTETRPRRFDNVDDSGVPRAIEELARQVSMFAGDVLGGDFAVLPRIRERAEENLRVTEARLYGR